MDYINLVRTYSLLHYHLPFQSQSRISRILCLFSLASLQVSEGENERAANPSALLSMKTGRLALTTPR